MNVLFAECSRWNAAKLVLGVVCAFQLCRALLAASVLLGLGSVPNAHPQLNAAPLTHLVQGGLLTVATILAFQYCERRGLADQRTARA